MKLLSVIIRVALIAAVVATPWLFGGVWAITQWALLLIAAILLAADLAVRFSHYDQSSWIPTAWIPIFLGLLLGIAQLVPLNTTLAGFFSPNMAKLRGELSTPASGETNSISEINGPVQQTRSLYPAATREYLALLVLATGCFYLASSHAIDRKSVLIFFTAIAICGAAISFFGVAQRLSWNGKFYWTYETARLNATVFGPFVNRNNAGGFLNMCLAGGLGLAVALHWHRSTAKLTEVSETIRHRSSSRRPKSENADDVARFKSKDRPESTSNDASSDSPQDMESTPEDDRAARYAAMLSGGDASATEMPAKHKPERIKVREKVKVKVKVEEDDGRAGQFSRSVRSSSYKVFSKKQPLVTRISEFFSDYFGSVSAQKLWSLALVGMCIGGVFCTASRGSIISLVAGMMVTAAALFARTGNRSFAIGLLVAMVAGAGLMSWAGQTDFVQYRLSQMFADEALESGRIPNWKEAMTSVPEYWVGGTGLGSYRFVYERYQDRFLNDVAHFHAENQFVQTLVEGGVIALVLLLSMIALTATCIYRLFLSSGVTNTSLAVAGTFALTTQVVGGSFDFGLYVTSNTMLMAVICGIVIGRAALVSVVGNLDALEDESGVQNYLENFEFIDSEERGSRKSFLPSKQLLSGIVTSRSSKHVSGRQLLAMRMPMPSFIAPSVIGFVFLGSVFGSLEMHKASIVESALAKSPLAEVREIRDPEVVRVALKPVRLAVAQRWDDALAHRHLSELLQHMYHAETYERLLFESNSASASQRGGSADETSEADRLDAIWRRSSVVHLFKTIHRALERDDSGSVAALKEQPLVVEYLEPALRHMLFARRYCPTIPHVHYALAELSPLSENEGDDKVHLDRAKQLSPADANLLFWSGNLSIYAGRIEDACHDWKTSLTIAPYLPRMDQILELVKSNGRGKITVGMLLNDVIPKHARLLHRFAYHFLAGDSPRLINARKKVLKRAADAIPETEMEKDQLYHIAALIYVGLDDTQNAIRYYKKAIEQNPKQHTWNYDLAKILLELGDLPEARKYAENAYDIIGDNKNEKLLVEIIEAMTKPAEKKVDAPDAGS